MKLLLIEDHVNLAETMVEVFKMYHWEPHWITTLAEALDCFDWDTYDVVISDFDLGRREPTNGVEIITKLHELNPDAKYIIYSGLYRATPEFAEFYLKDDILELTDKLEEIYND